MDQFTTLFQCWLIVIFFRVVLTERITSEYFTAFINVSYVDHNRGIFHTERTETGRFSSNSAQEVAGLVVELISNVTHPDDNTTYITDRSGRLIILLQFIIIYLP